MALLWACRGAPLGTAVADDYSFLYWLTFRRPLDPFDSMGAAFYWRPLSRQVYFGLVGPRLLEAPWLAPLIHSVLLLVLAALVYRIARRWAAGAVAGAIAACVVLSEPARVLLGWPSGFQHVLAGTAAVLAVHEALAGRLVTATVSAFVGILSHESAALALPMIPLAIWQRDRDRRATWRAIAAVGLVAAMWAAGYVVALRHGVVLPSPGSTSGSRSVLGRLRVLYPNATAAALDLEDVHGDVRVLVIGAAAGLALIAGTIAYVQPKARARLRAALPIVVPAALWFAVGVLPLLTLIPDWNAWRAWTPTIGFAVASAGALGAVSPWLAGGLAALKLAALFYSPIAPRSVSRVPPQNASHVSYGQLVRLQRVVSSTRAGLLSRVSTLPHGARVCYWEIPRLAEFAFQGSRALRVWYRDSSVVWDHFGGREGLKRHLDAAIEFRYGEEPFAVAIPVASVVQYQRAATLVQEQRYVEAQETLREAIRLSGIDHGPYFGSLVRNMGFAAYNRGAIAEAESLCDVATQRGTEGSDLWLLRSVLALHRGDRETAERDIRFALASGEPNAGVEEVARRLGVIP